MPELAALLKSPAFWFSNLVLTVSVGLLVEWLRRGHREFGLHLSNAVDGVLVLQAATVLVLGAWSGIFTDAPLMTNRPPTVERIGYIAAFAFGSCLFILLLFKFDTVRRLYFAIMASGIVWGIAGILASDRSFEFSTYVTVYLLWTAVSLALAPVSFVAWRAACVVWASVMRVAALLRQVAREVT